MSDIELGDRVRDRVSGFTGIAIARHQYINGCIRISVDPPVNDKGEYVEGRSFDEQQLEVMQKGAVTYHNEPVRQKPGQVVRGGPQSSKKPT